MPKRAKTHGHQHQQRKTNLHNYRGNLALVSCFVIAIRLIQICDNTTAEWTAFTARRWLRYKTIPLHNSSYFAATKGDASAKRVENATSRVAAEWPGKPVSTLLLNPEAMRLVRIGHGGPVENARGFLLDHLDEFLQVYQKRPDRNNLCGIRISHSLALYTIAKRLQPSVIVESGIGAGQSTYFFRNACPNAKIISLDPEPKPICGQPVRWIDNTKNEYLTGDKFVDFAQVNWKDRIAKGEIDPATTLIFFDDHRGFRPRLPSLLQNGFSKVIVEDNYLLGEGASRLDRMNLTPKQMWRNPSDPETKWLYAITNYYAEFPPILPPLAASGSALPKKIQGGFLHKSDNLSDMEEPIVRPELHDKDEQLFQKMATVLKLDKGMGDSVSYQEFMAYCFLCYLELAVVPPSLRQAWGSTM